MKNALVAVSPDFFQDKDFDRFCETLRRFQNMELIKKTSVVTIFHPFLTSLPFQFYSQEKHHLAEMALNRIATAITDRFAFETIEALVLNSAAVEDQVKAISEYCQKVDADLIILGSHDRKGMPAWFLGSFSETAALTSPRPVLIFKNPESPQFSEDVRFTFAIDLDHLPQESVIQWVAQLTRPSRAQVDLVHVKIPAELTVSEKEIRQTMQGIQQSFSALDVATEIFIIDERKSVAHTLAEHCEQTQSWALITTASHKTAMQRLLMGSQARQSLSLSRRPFLVVR